MESEEMNVDEMEVEVEEEETEEIPTSQAVMEAVEKCFAEGGEAYEVEGDAAIDAVIAKLEAMKTGDNEMGGLGMDEGPMDLGEAEA